MDSLTLRMLAVVVPLVVLFASFTLSELIRRQRFRQARHRLTAGKPGRSPATRLG
jgi:hypothetical protein